MLGQGWTYGINGSFGLVLTLVNHLQNFAWIYIIKVIIVICLLLKKKSLILNSIIKMLPFQLNFV